MFLRRSLIILTAALTVTAFSFSASASDDKEGMYLSGLGGVVFHMPSNVDKFASNGKISDVEYKAGWDGALALGYQSGPIRYELEAGYLKADADKFQRNSGEETGVTGNASAYTVMANLLYDFDDFEAFNMIVPYAGVGIGYLNTRIKLNSNGLEEPFDKSHAQFGYQGMAGLNFAISETVTVFGGYRYVGTGKITEYGKKFQAHTANAGIRVLF